MKKQTKFWIFLVILAILVPMLFIGCQKEEKVIKIGVVAPLSGNLAKQGDWMKKGIEMAKSQVSNINDYKVELIYEDTRCTSKETSTALNKLINVDSIVAYIGPFCGSSEFTAAEISKETKIIGLTPNLNYGKLNDYFISTQSFLSDEPKTIAKLAYNKLKIKKIAILYFNNDFGLIHKDIFKEEFEKLGGEITSIESINSFAQKDFRTELIKINSKNPEAIYIAYSSIGNIVNQMKELGMDMQILGQYGIETPDFLNVAKKNAEGIIYSYRKVGEKELLDSQKEFEKKYQNTYGESAGLIAAESYDAYLILANALNKCAGQFETNCIKDNILSTKDYQGASGTITFDPDTYNVDKPIAIKTVKNSQFVFYK